MNRSNGAYAPTKYYDFCIVLRLSGGASYQTVIRAHSSKFALGRAFSEVAAMAKMDGPQYAAAEKNAIAFCKSADEMTRDERIQWDVATDADHRSLRREQEADRLPMSMLDLY